MTVLGLKESPLITHEDSLNLAKLEDELRRQLGVVYPQDGWSYKEQLTIMLLLSFYLRLELIILSIWKTHIMIAKRKVHKQAVRYITEFSGSVQLWQCNTFYPPSSGLNSG